MFGLSVDTLRNIREAFVQFPGIEKVLLYGSRAKGNYKSGSDIDITLIGKNLTLDNSIYPLQGALDQLYLSHTFDISIFDQLDEPAFIDHILRVGKTFYERENGVMEGWEVSTIGATCQVTAGQSPKGIYYNDSGEGLAFYQGKKEFQEKYIGTPGKWTTKVTREAIAGDILMSVRAPVGPINFATERICIGRGLAGIRAGDKMKQEFLFYVLLAMQEQIKGSEGAVFSSINKMQIQNIQIPLPPLAEQERIVAILDDVFAAIATATANTKKNLANAQELFESALNRVVLSPESAEDSEDGVIEGWKESKIKDLVQPLTTVDPRKSPSLSFEYIDVSSVSRSRYLIKRTTTLSGSDAPSRARRRVQSGDILFATIRPTLQRIAIVPEHLEGAVCSTGYYVLRPRDQVLSSYLFYYLFSQTFADEMESLQRGASYPAVSDRDVKEHVAPLPPLLEQKRIVAFLDKLSKEKQSLDHIYKTKINALAELKQSLLHKAFTGELTADPKVTAAVSRMA